ncbi:hypothetical protein [Foetidibacter luteolus]|uniref:hypothetical protein n=1 Tax=Foetidibacter luteolus TaxID=2608880 RepID=UPI00129C0A54|nr:hypothetical protein [Foetidibacter luteolus]
MDTQLTAGSSNALVKIPAKLVSYLLHPLFVPTFIFIWMTMRFPYEFNIQERMLKLRMVTVFWTSAFFPAFTVFLLWRLKFISGIFLRNQKDRIVPYVATMFFYWWLWYLSKNFTDQPLALKSFFLGIFFSTILGLTINNFLKLSMHAMGAAGGWVFMILVCFHYGLHLGTDLSVATILAGLICSARLALSEHSTKEIYVGFFVGVISQLLAYIITF